MLKQVADTLGGARRLWYRRNKSKAKQDESHFSEAYDYHLPTATVHCHNRKSYHSLDFSFHADGAAAGGQV